MACNSENDNCTSRLSYIINAIDDILCVTRGLDLMGYEYFGLGNTKADSGVIQFNCKMHALIFSYHYGRIENSFESQYRTFAYYVSCRLIPFQHNWFMRCSSILWIFVRLDWVGPKCQSWHLHQAPEPHVDCHNPPEIFTMNFPKKWHW